MFYIIDTDKQLQELIDKNYQDAFIHIIDHRYKHPKLNEVLLIYYRPLNEKKGFICGFKHQDILSTSSAKIAELLFKTQNLHVLNAKKLLYYFKNLNLIDLSLIYNLQNNTQLEIQHDVSLISKINNDEVIPLVKHYEYCENIFEQIEYLTKNVDLENKAFRIYNYEVIPQLYEIEKQGLKLNIKEFRQHLNPNNESDSIKDNIIYTQYNIYTTTTRPSNNFNNINFSALNKTDGTRGCFIPKNDYFVEYDYESYHPRILAWLVKYKFFSDNSLYKQLAQIYFEKEKVTKEEIDESKFITFRQIYGGIDSKYLNHPFFNKVQQFTDKLWFEFNEKGYIEHHISGLKFYKDKLHNMTPSKLLNYYLQATETIRNIQKISIINEILKDKKTKLVLYNYDSFVLDVCNEEKQMLEKIYEILFSKEFPLKTKTGSSLNF